LIAENWFNGDETRATQSQEVVVIPGGKKTEKKYAPPPLGGSGGGVQNIVERIPTCISR
jgi:hypothetical protein